jgi:hypothetical protein
LPKRVRLYTQVESHKRQPQDEPNADDIPKVVSDAAKNIVEGECPCMANRLLDQTQGGTNQERIHRTQQKASGHAERRCDLGGEHQQKSKSHHGHHGHPAAGKGFSGFVKGVPIECECFGQNARHERQ